MRLLMWQMTRWLRRFSAQLAAAVAQAAANAAAASNAAPCQANDGPAAATWPETTQVTAQDAGQTIPESDQARLVPVQPPQPTGDAPAQAQVSAAVPSEQRGDDRLAASPAPDAAAAPAMPGQHGNAPARSRCPTRTCPDPASLDPAGFGQTSPVTALRLVVPAAPGPTTDRKTQIPGRDFACLFRCDIITISALRRSVSRLRQSRFSPHTGCTGGSRVRCRAATSASVSRAS